jgi:hypothetical protein
MPDPVQVRESDARFFVEIHPDAAKRFANVLLNVATTAGEQDREWLLWGVGMIAQSMGATPEGPDA